LGQSSKGLTQHGVQCYAAGSSHMLCQGPLLAFLAVPLVRWCWNLTNGADWCSGMNNLQCFWSHQGSCRSCC